MTIRASLKIRLLANDELVAESEDEQLWRRVLTAIQADTGGVSAHLDADDDAVDDEDEEPVESTSQAKKGVAKLAQDLGVAPDLIQGALDPSTTAPYLQLDDRSWEAFKRNTPSRGKNSVAGLQLAATLLCLWFRAAKIDGRPTQSQALQILSAIGAGDKNPSRSLKNCAWLQNRSGAIQLNPAMISRAQAVAKAFVTGTAIPHESED